MKAILEEILKSLRRFDFMGRACYTKRKGDNKGSGKQLPSYTGAYESQEGPPGESKGFARQRSKDRGRKFQQNL